MRRSASALPLECNQSAVHGVIVVVVVISMHSQLQPEKHTSFKKDAQNMQCLVKSATGVDSFSTA